jgi:hypothetical protein
MRIAAVSGPAASLGKQLRAMVADKVTQLALERLGFAGQHGDALDLLVGDTNPCGLRQRLVSAPMTIIQHVLSIEDSFEWTSGGQF